MNQKNHILTPILTAVILLLLIITKFLDTGIITRENEYVTILILECIIFAIPSIVFTRFFVQTPKNSFKIRLIGTGTVPLVILGSVILISGSILYGYITSGFNIQSSNAFILYDVFTAKHSSDFWQNFYLVFAYAAIPAIFEEFVFRGVVSSKYDEISPLYSIIMSSIMFGIIHLDLKTLPFHFLCGILLSVSMYASKSIFVPIIIHFVYNFFFLFFSDYTNAIFKTDVNFSVFIFGLLFFASLIIFMGECKRIYQRRAETEPLLSKFTNFKSDSVSVIEVILSPTALICYIIFTVSVFI